MSSACQAVATRRIVFDMDDQMGQSTCVACGECVQACPTGALLPATVVDENQVGDTADYDREVSSVCLYCGVGCQLSFKTADDEIKYVGGSKARPTRTGSASRAVRF